MQKLFILMSAFVLFVSCENERKKNARSFESALEADTGQRHTIVKLSAEQGWFTVFRNEATGEYVAYNMSKWNGATMTSFSQYQGGEGDVYHNLAEDREWVTSGEWVPKYENQLVYFENYDSTCNCFVQGSRWEDVMVGTQWVDTSHWYIFYRGGGLRFENSAGASKDLELIGALKDQAAESLMKAKFKSEFALSDNRAGELASLANKYQKLENARELTSSEKDKFALSALGVSMNQVEEAMKAKAEGKEAQYDALLEKAAKVNSTSPESIGKFFEVMSEGL